MPLLSLESLRSLLRGIGMDSSRRSRGILGIAALWGGALSVIATSTLAIGLATGLVPADIFGARELVAVAVRGLIAGAVAGGLFAWTLAARESKQTLGTLKPRRVALWGFVAAAGVPLLASLAVAGPALPLGVLAAGVIGFGALGSVLSTATLRLARRSATALPRADDEWTRLIR
jgi:hypothetical protein